MIQCDRIMALCGNIQNGRLELKIWLQIVRRLWIDGTIKCTYIVSWKSKHAVKSYCAKTILMTKSKMATGSNLELWIWTEIKLSWWIDATQFAKSKHVYKRCQDPKWPLETITRHLKSRDFEHCFYFNYRYDHYNCSFVNA